MKILRSNPILIKNCFQCSYLDSRVRYVYENRNPYTHGGYPNFIQDVKFCRAAGTEIASGDGFPDWCPLADATKEEEKLWSTQPQTTPA